jgi:DNA polymerase-3 subunit delta'
VRAFPDTLRPTILSRCRRLRFGPLSEHDVARVLIERHNVERAKAQALAAVSGGSPAYARTIDDKALVADRDAALSLLQAATRQNVFGRLKAAAVLAKNDKKSGRRDRESLSLRLAVIESLLRDLIAVSARPQAVVNRDLEPELRRLHASYSAERASRGFQAVVECQAALERNASPKIVADWIATHL